MKAITASDMKQINRKVVFDLVRRERTVTRVGLSERTGLSGPSILTVVNEFLEKGILSAAGKKNGLPGRSPMTMVFNPDVLLSIGFEFDGESLSCGLVNLDGEIRFLSEERVPPELGADFFEMLCRKAVDLQRRAQAEGLCCSGIGLGIPGAVDIRERIVRFAPNIGMQNPVDISGLVERLESRCGLPVFVENDVNASAIGEFYRRKIREEVSDLLYVSVGTGIGAGLILDGRLRHGARGLCGEIGYSLRSIGEPVSRQSAGWLERRLSREALEQRFGAYRESAGAGAEMARYVAETLCPILANLVNVLDIRLVVLGGQLLSAGDVRLLCGIREELQALALSPTAVEQGDTARAGVVGCALLASDQLWETIL